jgi:hypothetical protein
MMSPHEFRLFHLDYDEVLIVLPLFPFPALNRKKFKDTPAKATTQSQKATTFTTTQNQKS